VNDAGSDDSFISAHFQKSRLTLEAAANDTALRATVHKTAAVIVEALGRGGKLLIAGNGGSAADAQHIAAEFLSRLNFDRHPLPAIALTTDTSVLTAVGNDYGFDRIFERQIQGLGKTGDVFIGISTSGKSPNVIAALKAAREIGVVTVGFSGNAASPMTALCDHMLAAPSHETALIQQVHIVAAHIICGLVERRMFGKAGG
jgi:D-sedoheptulose 7-phosphate isomerase